MGIDGREVVLELFKRQARCDLLSFLRWVWWWPPDQRPLKVGRHTRALCERLTRAVEDFKEGKSTYLIINMPFRHGKSDLVSRALPAYFLGRCQEFQPDIIMSGYGTSLVKGFSKKVQGIVGGKAYGALFPEVRVDPLRHAAEEWNVENSQGTVVAQGLGGSITGKGGNLIIVDDYCKSREEAESRVMRDKVWESFRDDLMTRTNAPAAVVVVCATRWHVDDVVGRIYESMKQDEHYPRFESLIFPARKEGAWETLFPELYDKEWYVRQRASLGSYSSAALLDCEPIGESMRVFKESWVCFYDSMPERNRMNIYIFVDSANSKKEAADYTTLWVIGFCDDLNYYILDCVHDRLNLRERTDALFALVRAWRPNNVFWEQVGAMADVAHVVDVQDREKWHFGIHALVHRVSKDTRIRSLQPLFEGHRVWFPRNLKKVSADGNVYDPIERFIHDEYINYPGIKHDDMIDPLADICDKEVAGMTSFPMSTGDNSTDFAVTEWLH